MTAPFLTEKRKPEDTKGNRADTPLRAEEGSVSVVHGFFKVSGFELGSGSFSVSKFQVFGFWDFCTIPLIIRFTSSPGALAPPRG